MNIQKTIGYGILSGALSLGALALNGCSNGKFLNNNENTKTTKVDSIDLTKPNKPLIEGNKISYKKLDGELVTLRTETGLQIKNTAATSLYKTISSMSTEQKPNIDDVEKFYVEFEKNNDKSSGINEARLPQIQASMLFNNLFKLFTAPDSDGGNTITVKEYTQMMDAWSSFLSKD